MIDRLDATIAAVSTAPGTAALGIVRLSGPDAIPIADRMAEAAGSTRLRDSPGHSWTPGLVRPGEDSSVPARFFVFRAPRSYTGQDLVEIHTLGVAPLLALIRERAIELGAIPAGPGEFTARAFLNGRMDLATAEGVAGVIRAQSDVQLRAARWLMDGHLTQRISGFRDEVASLAALIEAEIDFSEEPIDFISPSDLQRRLAAVRKGIADLAGSSGPAERPDDRPRIQLFGPPNAGKSTLMNGLSGVDRAIIAAVEGTTRDPLTVTVRWGRIEAVLVDSAGVSATVDEAEAQARELTQSHLGRADVVCVVLDAPALARSVADDPNVDSMPASVLPMRTALRSLEQGAAIVALSKCDLVHDRDLTRVVRWVERWRIGEVLCVSAKTRVGIDALRVALANALSTEGDSPGRATTTGAETAAVTARQRACLLTAAESLTRAERLGAQADHTIDTADLLAFELREALDALAAVTGTVTTEDLLGQVFRDFCVGK